MERRHRGKGEAAALHAMAAAGGWDEAWKNLTLVCGGGSTRTFEYLAWRAHTLRIVPMLANSGNHTDFTSLNGTITVTCFALKH
jgi:hypothetical protein